MVRLYGSQSIDHITCDDLIELFRTKELPDIVASLTQKVHSIPLNANIYMLGVESAKVYVIQKTPAGTKKWISIALDKVCLDLNVQVMSIINKLDDEITEQKDKWDCDSDIIHNKINELRDKIATKSFTAADRAAIAAILVGFKPVK